jgi:hypothetical protein
VHVTVAAFAARQVVLQIRIALGQPGALEVAARASGARPRLVWMITPVALTTRRSDRRPAMRPDDGARLERAIRSMSDAAPDAASVTRGSSAAWRAARITASRPWRATAACTAARWQHLFDRRNVAE